MESEGRLHAVVSGRVQGVGFRQFVWMNGVEMGLTGWVRNRWNGDVEVLAEGSREQLGLLLNFLHRGPRSAFVSKVQTEWLSATGEFAGFDVYATL